MNMNEKRLGAYQKILKQPATEEPAPEGFVPWAENMPPKHDTAKPASGKAAAEAALRSAIAAKGANALPGATLAAKQTGKTTLGANQTNKTTAGAASSAGAAQTGSSIAAQNGSSSTAQKAAQPAQFSAGAVPPKREGKDSVSLNGLIKVPVTGPDGKESPYRKVAKFLLLIGVEEAAKVMAKLTPEQTEKVVLELASIRRVDPDEASVVLAEFESLLRQAREPAGGVDTARTILEAAFGPERAEEMLLRAVPYANGRPFDYLDGIDSDRLLRLIADELPAVKALVLSQLKPSLAAAVIKLMPDADKNDVVIRLARLKSINPEVVRRVDETMREKVTNLSAASADSIDGRSALAEILKRMDSSSERAILSGLTDADPDLGKDLRERLFTIDDVVRCDDRFLQSTLRPMAERDLAILIAGKDELFRSKILANLSKTRGAVVLEEEQIAQPISRADSERVTGAFFATVRRAWESGECFIDGRDGKEVWV